MVDKESLLGSRTLTTGRLPKTVSVVANAECVCVAGACLRVPERAGNWEGGDAIHLHRLLIDN